MRIQLLPHSVDSEPVLLGIALPDRERAEAINPDRLYITAHKVILRAAQNLHARNIPVNDVTLTAELRARGDLEEAGGPERLSRLFDLGMGGTEAFAFHHEAVAMTAWQRDGIREINALLREIWSPLNGQGARPILERFEGLRRIMESVPRAENDSASDLAEKLSAPEKPADWTLEPFFQPGRSCLGSGKAKSKKTTIAQCMSLSIAAGRDFAGRFKTTQRRVLALDGEMGEDLHFRLWRRLGRGEGLNVAQLAKDGLLHYLNLADPDVSRDPKQWARLVREREIGHVTLDPVVAFVTDENDAPTVRRWWNEVAHRIQEAGASFQAIHHSRKGSLLLPDSPEDSSRGSGDWRGAPDVHVGLALDPKDRALIRVEITGSRLGLEPSPFYLRVEDHEGGQRIVFAGEPENAIGKILACADAIEGLLNVAGDGGLPRESIIETMGDRFALRTITDALKQVRERGDVETRKVGRTVVYQRVMK